MPKEIHHENIKTRRWRIPSYSNQSNSIKASTNGPNIVQKYDRLRLPLVITSIPFHTVVKQYFRVPMRCYGLVWPHLGPR